MPVARCGAGRRRRRSGGAPSSHRAVSGRGARCGGPGPPARTRSHRRAGAASAPRPARTRRPARGAVGHPARSADDRRLAAGAGSWASAAQTTAAETTMAETTTAETTTAETTDGRDDDGRSAGLRAWRRGWVADRTIEPGADPPVRRVLGAGLPRTVAAVAATGARRRIPARLRGRLLARLRGRLLTRLRRSPGAAARAGMPGRATPRSTSSDAGSRAARPPVQAALPGPIVAARAGARSTSFRTSPSSQVVAPRSA